MINIVSIKLKTNYLIKFLFCISLIKSDPGDLIDFNERNTFTIESIEILLGSLGELAPSPIYPISVYDISYESHNQNGTIDTLSGLVSIPQNYSKAFPIAVYNHGTIILDSQAPSITGMSIENFEILLAGLVTTPSGFITLFPDYKGIGDPSFHPYIISEPHTLSVINMLRSVKFLNTELNSQNKFQYNNQIFLLGYSDGGYATLASQKGIELFYDHEFQITASFPMAGPYDLAGTMVDYFLSNPEYSQPYYVPYVLTSHLWYYQGLEVNFMDYFNPFWADTLPSLFDGSHSGAEINQIMPENPLDIILPDVLEDFINNEDNIFNQTFRENTLLGWVPNSPTHIYHGIGDDIVPYQNAQIVYDDFLNNGAENVELILFPEFLGGHSQLAPICLISGFNTMLNYQIINEKGDVDNNTIIDFSDFLLLQSEILNQDLSSSFLFWSMDLDSDYFISIFDLLLLSDIIDT
ncbi:MAG: hypothetical protein CMG62_01285 [Candidatus Marinimicrobia bacterium]|nr:hypothetical protein [Candidatus Neomarinimicrobiota bacterium]